MIVVATSRRGDVIVAGATSVTLKGETIGITWMMTIGRIISEESQEESI